MIRLQIYTHLMAFIFGEDALTLAESIRLTPKVKQ